MTATADIRTSTLQRFLIKKTKTGQRILVLDSGGSNELTKA